MVVLSFSVFLIGGSSCSFLILSNGFLMNSVFIELKGQGVGVIVLAECFILR